MAGGEVPLSSVIKSARWRALFKGSEISKSLWCGRSAWGMQREELYHGKVAGAGFEEHFLLVLAFRED